MKSTTFRSHNENGRKQIEIERDATLWEMVCRIVKARSFRVSNITKEVYERETCIWVNKVTREVLDLPKARELNAIMIETAYFNHLMEHKI
jgi:hypothetical protein